MSHIRTQIDKLFLNSKVGELFSNSDGGQGMIDTEIDRHFSFEEIREIVHSFANPQLIIFLDQYQDHVNLNQFFTRLKKRMVELSDEYKIAISRKRVMEILNNNQSKIKNRFPSFSLEEAQKEFAKLYVLKHREIRQNTFEQVKDFFDNPVSWI